MSWFWDVVSAWRCVGRSVLEPVAGVVVRPFWKSCVTGVWRVFFKHPPRLSPGTFVWRPGQMAWFPVCRSSDPKKWPLKTDQGWEEFLSWLKRPGFSTSTGYAVKEAMAGAGCTCTGGRDKGNPGQRTSGTRTLDTRGVGKKFQTPCPMSKCTWGSKVKITLLVDSPEACLQADFFTASRSWYTQWLFLFARWQRARLFQLFSTTTLQWTPKLTYILAWSLPVDPELVKVLEVFHTQGIRPVVQSLQMVRKTLCWHKAASHHSPPLSNQVHLISWVQADDTGHHSETENHSDTRDHIWHMVFWKAYLVLARHLIASPHKDLRAETWAYVAKKYPFLPTDVHETVLTPVLNPEDSHDTSNSGWRDREWVEDYERLSPSLRRHSRCTLNTRELARASPYFHWIRVKRWQLLLVVVLVPWPVGQGIILGQRLVKIFEMAEKIQVLQARPILFPALKPLLGRSGERSFENWLRFLTTRSTQTVFPPWRAIERLLPHLPATIPLGTLFWDAGDSGSPSLGMVVWDVVPQTLNLLEGQLAQVFGSCQVRWEGESGSCTLKVPCGVTP